MIDQESLKYEIPWDLPYVDFQAFIRDMIKECRDNGKVIALPVETLRKESLMGQMAMLIAQVDCKDCHLCCTSGEYGNIDISQSEYQVLSEKYGRRHFVGNGKELAIPYPCPFLQSDKCSIYGDRPLVCVLYPFQTGGYGGENGEIFVIAVASSCPEGRRIARGIYMTSWRLRRQFKRANPFLYKTQMGLE